MADQEHPKGGHERPVTRRQKQGYDEAARGGPDVPASDVGLPDDEEAAAGSDAFDRAARDAERDVRRRDKSAS